jgi:hypothetical protein
MNDTEKRFFGFLCLCITTRLLFVFLAKIANLDYLKLMGYIALIPALGFTYIFITGSRQSGQETFGQPIWWNSLRPIHALLYFLFAYHAIHGDNKSWVFLLIDVIIGLCGFGYYHYVNDV